MRLVIPQIFSEQDQGSSKIQEASLIENTLAHIMLSIRDVASFGLGGAMASPKFFLKNIIYIYIYVCVCVLILAILLYKITFFSLKQYN